ncbi:MAG: hypothetical protein WEE64_08795 [Dehalococcoidia bacterium]
MTAAPVIDADFLRKLGLKPGHRLGLVGAPGEWVKALGHIADAAAWRSIAKAREADVILVWLEPSDDLRATFDALESRIPPDGAVWAVIPKKSALAKGEDAVEWATMQAAGLASGRLVDNKELRFDDRYYGTRFVVRKEQR